MIAVIYRLNPLLFLNFDSPTGLCRLPVVWVSVDTLASLLRIWRFKDVFESFSRRILVVFATCSRRLRDVCSSYSRRFCVVFSRRILVVFATSSRRLRDVFSSFFLDGFFRRFLDVFPSYLGRLCPSFFVLLGVAYYQ
uniref:Uncharacterized protein n=1 Tax=Cacopsylla melanoneura TaxID=428564 RepID=A0A8D8R3V3_9HEMI